MRPPKEPAASTAPHQKAVEKVKIVWYIIFGSSGTQVRMDCQVRKIARNSGCPLNEASYPSEYDMEGCFATKTERREKHESILLHHSISDGAQDLSL